VVEQLRHLDDGLVDLAGGVQPGSDLTPLPEWP
jgi:hypothetical protein